MATKKLISRAEVLQARDQLSAQLQQFKRDADAELAALLQSELSGAIDRYEQLKRAAANVR